MLMIVDYIAYYFFVMVCYKLLNVFFKSNKPLGKSDLYEVGVLSLIVYVWMYSEHGLFMVDGFV